MRRQTAVSGENKAQSQLQAIAFVKVLHKLISTARIHNDNNKLIIECLTKFKTALNDITKEGDLKFQAWRGRFHFDGEKLLHGRDTFHIINELIKYFADRGIGGFNFLIASQNAHLKTL
jgi:hypothetical protein